MPSDGRQCPAAPRSAAGAGAQAHDHLVGVHCTHSALLAGTDFFTAEVLTLRGFMTTARLRSHNPHRDRDGRGSNNRTEQADNGNHWHLHPQRDRRVRWNGQNPDPQRQGALRPTEGDNERGPAYRIVAAATEFGAAWKKTSRETGREYLSVKLDDPSFPALIYASLVADEEGGGHSLIWSRRTGD